MHSSLTISVHPILIFAISEFGNTVQFGEFVFSRKNVQSGAFQLSFSRRKNDENVSVGCEPSDDEIKARCLDRKLDELMGRYWRIGEAPVEIWAQLVRCKDREHSTENNSRKRILERLDNIR